MKNLKLSDKMLVLSMILMGSMFAVSIAAVNRISEFNSQIRWLVDHTIQKRERLFELHTMLLASVRARRMRSFLRTSSNRWSLQAVPGHSSSIRDPPWSESSP